MLHHQLGQNLVLLLDPLLQFHDPFLVFASLGSALAFQCQGGVAEQLLLPAMEQAGGQSLFFANL